MSKEQRLIEPDINDACTSRTSIVEGQMINASAIAPFMNEKEVSLQEAYTEIGGFGKFLNNNRIGRFHLLASVLLTFGFTSG